MLEKGLYTHPDPDGRTEVVEVAKKYGEGDGDAGFFYLHPAVAARAGHPEPDAGRFAGGQSPV